MKFLISVSSKKVPRVSRKKFETLSPADKTKYLKAYPNSSFGGTKSTKASKKTGNSSKAQKDKVHKQLVAGFKKHTKLRDAVDREMDKGTDTSITKAEDAFEAHKVMLRKLKTQMLELDPSSSIRRRII